MVSIYQLYQLYQPIEKCPIANKDKYSTKNNGIVVNRSWLYLIKNYVDNIFKETFDVFSKTTVHDSQ